MKQHEKTPIAFWVMEPNMFGKMRRKRAVLSGDEFTPSPDSYVGTDDVFRLLLAFSWQESVANDTAKQLLTVSKKASTLSAEAERLQKENAALLAALQEANKNCRDNKEKAEFQQGRAAEQQARELYLEAVIAAFRTERDALQKRVEDLYAATIERESVTNRTCAAFAKIAKILKDYDDGFDNEEEEGDDDAK